MSGYFIVQSTSRRKQVIFLSLTTVDHLCQAEVDYFRDYRSDPPWEGWQRNFSNERFSKGSTTRWSMLQLRWIWQCWRWGDSPTRKLPIRTPPFPGRDAIWHPRTTNLSMVSCWRAGHAYAFYLSMPFSIWNIHINQFLKAARPYPLLLWFAILTSQTKSLIILQSCIMDTPAIERQVWAWHNNGNNIFGIS